MDTRDKNASRATSAITRIVVLGFGNIGQALLPLLCAPSGPGVPIRLIDERMRPEQIAQIERARPPSGGPVPGWRRQRITRDNLAAVLDGEVGPGTLVINLATSIGSRDLIEWTQQRQAFYLDTCIDPWDYQDGVLAQADNTNYRLREEVLALQAAQRAGGTPQPTAVVAHGANPGLVSLLVKRGLQMLAAREGGVGGALAPQTPLDWARLAEALGVRVIQIAERDSQAPAGGRRPDEFVNTWSVDGFVAEALQPAELGWGSHEEGGPMAARVHHHAQGCRAAVYLAQAGAHTPVRSWSPGAGAFTGRLISHNESISIADFLTVPDPAQPDPRRPRYRPTVYYAYHPCDLAMASLGLLAEGTRAAIRAQRVLKDEIVSGVDELGVLLLSDRHPALWLGSQLDIDRARALAPCNNATSLQVVGSMMAAIAWIEAHPRAGIVESEALDHDAVLAHAAPCWAPIVHAFADWHPQPGRAVRRWTLDEFLVRPD
ncbi:MAG: homospermidine synthase [Pseudomonadota bacterium]|nr:homospermidine synthase [Pseudomonadota bacterium]